MSTTFVHLIQLPRKVNVLFRNVPECITEEILESSMLDAYSDGRPSEFSAASTRVDKWLLYGREANIEATFRDDMDERQLYRCLCFFVDGWLMDVVCEGSTYTLSATFSDDPACLTPFHRMKTLLPMWWEDERRMVEQQLQDERRMVEQRRQDERRMVEQQLQDERRMVEQQLQDSLRLKDNENRLLREEIKNMSDFVNDLVDQNRSAALFAMEAAEKQAKALQMIQTRITQLLKQLAV